jgi:hypothetical protein
MCSSVYPVHVSIIDLFTKVSRGIDKWLWFGDGHSPHADERPPHRRETTGHQNEL